MKTLIIASVLTLSVAAAATAAGAKTSGPAPTPTPTPTTFNSGATVYGSRAAFTAAAGTTTTDGFEVAQPTDTNGLGIKSFASGTYTDPTGTTFSAPTTGSVVNLNVLDASYTAAHAPAGYFTTGDVLTGNYEALTIHFNHAVTSFGIDFGSTAIAFAPASERFSFTVAGLGTQQVYSSASGLSFLGFTSQTAFDTVTIAGSSVDNHYFDNVTGTAAPVPEPAEFGMMGLGLAVVGAAARRRRRAN